MVTPPEREEAIRPGPPRIGSATVTTAIVGILLRRRTIGFGMLPHDIVASVP